MKIKRLLAIPFLLISLFTLAQGTKNFIDLNYIEVTGKAEMKVIPDEIYLNITINEADNKGKEQVETLERKMIDRLKSLGVNIEKDFAIKDMSSNFKDYWLKKNDIQTSKSYELVVHQASMAGKVYQELEKLGISNIEIQKVDHSQMEQLRREVKVNAVKAGKEKATDLAGAAGQTIGRAIYIREIENFYGPVRTSNMMMKANFESMDSEMPAPEVQFEAITLEYSVQLYFELL